MAKIITAANFKEEVLDYSGVVLVDFFATWCGPCKALSPILDTLDGQFPDVKILKVDIDADSALAREYQVMSVPNMKLFKSGKMVESIVGLHSEGELKEKLTYYTA